jgi:hypothetical protein
MARNPVTAAADFEDLLNTWMTTVDIDDLKAVLRDTVDHRTARRDAVAWLADTLGREAFVAAAVEAGVLERPTVLAFGQEYRAGYFPADPDEPASVDKASMTLDPDAVPLYRVAGTGEVDRG